MNDDLISRAEAIEAIMCEPTDAHYPSWYAERLEQLPSEQPERMRGKWKTALLDHEAFGVRPKVLYCSECNQCIAYPTRYCPNCGADMRGEQDE